MDQPTDGQRLCVQDLAAIGRFVDEISYRTGIPEAVLARDYAEEMLNGRRQAFEDAWLRIVSILSMDVALDQIQEIHLKGEEPEVFLGRIENSLWAIACTLESGASFQDRLASLLGVLQPDLLTVIPPFLLVPVAQAVLGRRVDISDIE